MVRPAILAIPVLLLAVSPRGAMGQPPSGDPCTPPGTMVAADPSGDVTNPELDILGISMMEFFSGPYAGKFMVTLQVRQLASPQPASSALWIVTWKDATGQNTMNVSMSDCEGQIAFHYDYQTPDGSGSQSGEPDAGSFTTDGRIQIVLSRDKFGDPPAGAMLTAIGAVTEPMTPVPPAGCLPNLAGQDVSNEPGTYTMGSCVVAAPPYAFAAGLQLGPPLPNPARAGVQLALDIPQALAGRWLAVTVLDAAGRRIRTVARGLAVPGRTRLGWDLRSESGSRVAPGSYWIAASAGGAFRSQRVEVLR